MRIRCPYCGERDSSEFTYGGAANRWRPPVDQTDTQERVFKAVYLRENPAGPHGEFWYHVFGCRTWLQVVRDTRTHEITTVDLVKGAAS